MTDGFLPLLAVAFVVAGGICFYLGTCRQQWLDRSWTTRASGGGGIALLGLGWLAWCGEVRPATALFAVLTVTMTALILVPAAVALWAASRRGGA